MSWKWLTSTKALQEVVYKVDFESIRNDPDARREYLMTNFFAALDEIHEAARELQWKPWAKNRGALNRDAMIEELVDTAHFLANALVALDCDDEEWEAVYESKQRTNAARQLSGYEARGHELRDAYGDPLDVRTFSETL